MELVGTEAVIMWQMAAAAALEAKLSSGTQTLEHAVEQAAEVADMMVARFRERFAEVEVKEKGE